MHKRACEPELDIMLKTRVCLCSEAKDILRKDPGKGEENRPNLYALLVLELYLKKKTHKASPEDVHCLSLHP